MTYNKPLNMTYVAMCIYFDANIYKASRDDNLLYQYLYHVCYMLACVSKYFKNYDDYDDFALYASSRIYLRYPSAGACESTPAEKKYKSILNYTKATLYPLKVDYQKENFTQIYSYKNEDGIDSLVNLTKESIQKDYSHGLYDSIIDALKLLPNTIKKRILETPYKNDVLMFKKLYLSCLLTFINSMTLSREKLDKIQERGDINEREELLIKSLQREKTEATMV